MVNSANKTQKENRMKGHDKERELELLIERARYFTSYIQETPSNSYFMDERIRQVREMVSTSVKQVLEGEKAQSMQQLDADYTVNETHDPQSLDNTTRQTDQAVNATLQRLKNIL